MTRIILSGRVIEENRGYILNEPLPPLFYEEVGVSYYLHQRSFCAEEGGLLLLDEFIGSLLDGSSKQHRH
jgi:hypothetical protein